MNTTAKWMMMTGLVLALCGACTPLKGQDDKQWQSGWNTGSRYSPPQTDI